MIVNAKRVATKVSLFLTLIFTAGAVSAQTSCNGTTACSGPANELIRGVFPAESGSGSIVLIDSATAVSQLPCTGANGGNNIRLSGTNSVFKESYATLLTAIAANLNVVLRVTDASSNNATACELQYVQVLTNSN